MNGLWTHTGMPAMVIPAGTVGGLPFGLQFGLQFVGAFGADETLLAHADLLATAVSERS